MSKDIIEGLLASTNEEGNISYEGGAKNRPINKVNDKSGPKQDINRGP